jgi:hypothetical protein
MQFAVAPFYKTIVYIGLAWVYLDRGQLAAAEQSAHDGLAAGAAPESMHCIEALVALRSGRIEEARRLVSALDGSQTLVTGSAPLAAACAVRLGDIPAALRFMSHPSRLDIAHTISRLMPDLHPLLDHAPFAPRRSRHALVWPLEAPMIDAARHALFKEVRIESGIPRASDVLAH